MKKMMNGSKKGTMKPGYGPSGKDKILKGPGVGLSPKKKKM